MVEQSQGPGWQPRARKSPLRVWTRYTTQWVWGPPLWLLSLLPYLVFAALGDLLPDENFDEFSGGGRVKPRGRRRRRLWLSRSRRRRELATDPQQLEAAIGDLLERRYSRCDPAVRPVGAPGHAHYLELDDSYYRQIGAARALQLAEAYGWRAVPKAQRDLPTWLVLRGDCPFSGRGKKSRGLGSGGAPSANVARQPLVRDSAAK